MRRGKAIVKLWSVGKQITTFSFSTQGVYLMGVNQVADDSWNAHIRYLEDEVKKLDERAGKLEKMIPDMKNEPKKHACRKLINDLLSCLSWNWRGRSSVKITERTHAKRAKTLHRRGEGGHSTTALVG
ncbi:MAG: hypothetical protein WCA19_00945, partial [Candidatus Acidiferrales bacterium]